MNHVSRPLIGLLVATVAFFALWVVALKPSSSSNGSGSQGLGSYQSAIAKAHQAVAISNGASAAHGGTVSATAAGAAHGGTVSSTPASTTPAHTPSTSAPTAGTTAKPARSTGSTATGHARVSPSAGTRLDTVSRALKSNKVLALLFYNPAAADDQAVKQELAAIPKRALVVKLAVPLSELARYTVVTNQVPVNVSPTLVLIDPDQQATTIVGFADRFEISQRVADAAAVK